MRHARGRTARQYERRYADHARAPRLDDALLRLAVARQLRARRRQGADVRLQRHRHRPFAQAHRLRRRIGRRFRQHPLHERLVRHRDDRQRAQAHVHAHARLEADGRDDGRDAGQDHNDSGPAGAHAQRREYSSRRGGDGDGRASLSDGRERQLPQVLPREHRAGRRVAALALHRGGVPRARLAEHGPLARGRAGRPGGPGLRRHAPGGRLRRGRHRVAAQGRPRRPAVRHVQVPAGEPLRDGPAAVPPLEVGRGVGEGTPPDRRERPHA